MSKGDKYCIICNAWLGNYITGETPTGTASYYSLIKRKYCQTCKPWKRQQDFCFYSHEYRKRKKKLDKEREQAFLMLQAENRALKQMLFRMREEAEK